MNLFKKHFKPHIMKTLSILITGLSFILTITCSAIDNPGSQAKTSAATSTSAFQVKCSPELIDLATLWSTEFGKQNPAQLVHVEALSQKVATSGNDLYLVSENEAAAFDNTSNRKLVVGRDAIVLIMNSANPYIKELNLQGISKDDLGKSIVESGNLSWSSILNNECSGPMHLYFLDRKDIKSAIAGFTMVVPINIKGTTIPGTEELMSIMKKDNYAIGICSLDDVRDAASGELKQGISLIPIDKNGNGRMDKFENIYDNLQAFSRGVWIGKYPAALCESIYAIIPITADNKNENASSFISWILSEGQQFLDQTGYAPLAASEIKSNLDALTQTSGPVLETQQANAIPVWLIVLSSFILIGMILLIIVWAFGRKSSKAVGEEITFTSVLGEQSITAPKGLYFDKTHTWAFLEKDGFVRVGIDDFLQHLTGTITRIKMKEPGDKIRKGEQIMTIMHEGKQLDIYAPVSGTIRNCNQTLLTDSSIMNVAPYADGWVYTIEPKNWIREIQFMFLGDQYQEWIKNEFGRLRDFFAVSVRSNQAMYAQVILQDGGELTDNILKDMGPEVWEDFQNRFLDTSR
jgi:glycine cleavage system H lipoate-binding protein/ABC-type phosphate transport system substrate-binding protein